MANFFEDLTKRFPTIIKNYITDSKEIVREENKATRPLVRNDDCLKQHFPPLFLDLNVHHFPPRYSRYSSLGPAFKWKEKHLGTDKAVQISDPDSFQCN